MATKSFSSQTKTTAEKEELAEECKNSGDDEVIQEKPVIAKFLV